MARAKRGSRRVGDEERSSRKRRAALSPLPGRRPLIVGGSRSRVKLALSPRYAGGWMHGSAIGRARFPFPGRSSGFGSANSGSRSTATDFEPCSCALLAHHVRPNCIGIPIRCRYVWLRTVIKFLGNVYAHIVGKSHRKGIPTSRYSFFEFSVLVREVRLAEHLVAVMLVGLFLRYGVDS